MSSHWRLKLKRAVGPGGGLAGEVDGADAPPELVVEQGGRRRVARAVEVLGLVGEVVERRVGRDLQVVGDGTRDGLPVEDDVLDRLVDVVDRVGQPSGTGGPEDEAHRGRGCAVVAALERGGHAPEVVAGRQGVGNSEGRGLGGLALRADEVGVAVDLDGVGRRAATGQPAQERRAVGLGEHGAVGRIGADWHRDG